MHQLAEVGDVYVVVGCESEQVGRAVRGAFVVLNPQWERGMGASIAAGVRAVSLDEYDAVLIATCDQYRVGSDLFTRMVDRLRDCGADAVGVRYDEIIGVPAVFTAAAAQKLTELDGEQGARSLLRNGILRVDGVDAPEASRDVDTPEDLSKL